MSVWAGLSFGEVETGLAVVSLGQGLPHEEQSVRTLLFPHVSGGAASCKKELIYAC